MNNNKKEEAPAPGPIAEDAIMLRVPIPEPIAEDLLMRTEKKNRAHGDAVNIAVIVPENPKMKNPAGPATPTL